MFVKVRPTAFDWYFHRIAYFSRNKSEISTTIQKHKQAPTNGDVSKNVNKSLNISEFSRNVQTQYQKENDGQTKETVQKNIGHYTKKKETVSVYIR